MNFKKYLGGKRISDSQKEVILWRYEAERIAWKLSITFGSIQEMIDNANYVGDDGGGRSKVIIGGDFDERAYKRFGGTNLYIEFFAIISKDGDVQINNKKLYGGYYWDVTKKFQEYIDKGLYPVNIDWYDGWTYAYSWDKRDDLRRVGGIG